MQRVLVLALLAGLPAFADEPVVPVYDEPRHRLVAEGDVYRVLDLRIPPGDTTLYHVHDQPIFYITLNSPALKAQELGQDWIMLPRQPSVPGDVRYNDDYVAQPVTHRVSNVSEEDLRLILVLNERGTLPAPEPHLVSSMPGIAGVDSRYFTQSRLELGPNERLDWTGPDRLVVYVLMTDTHVVIRRHGGERNATGLYDPGDFVAIAPRQAVTVDNRSDRPAEFIAVAVR